MSRKHPIIAAIYDRMLESEEKAFLARLRKDTISLARGTVVEIGVGTGRNFPHYPKGSLIRLDAVEPDPYMRRRAEPRAVESGLPINFVEATAENLPFPDCYADTIVSTLVLCSVDRPLSAIAELHRVLKPNSQLLFIEHVRSNDPWRVRLENLITPFWRRVAGNCHPNRPTISLLQLAGFDVKERERVTCHAPFGQPMIAGIAARS